VAFHVTHRSGGDSTDPTPEQLRSLIDELDIEDDEHPEISLAHEREWCLSAFPGGLVVFENVDTGDNPRHLRDCTRAELQTMFEELAGGDIDAVTARPWRPGYG
jgi:hypothetical protein